MHPQVARCTSSSSPSPHPAPATPTPQAPDPELSLVDRLLKRIRTQSPDADEKLSAPDHARMYLGLDQQTIEMIRRELKAEELKADPETRGAVSASLKIVFDIAPYTPSQGGGKVCGRQLP